MMKEFEKLVTAGFNAGRVKFLDAKEARAARLEAEIDLLKERGKGTDSKAKDRK
jgi:hypothetical protein